MKNNARYSIDLMDFLADEDDMPLKKGVVKSTISRGII